MSRLAQPTMVEGFLPSPTPRLFRAIHVYMISRSPGRNTSTSPACWSSAPRTTPATSSANCMTPFESQLPRSGMTSLCTTSTGNVVPSLTTVSASFRISLRRDDKVPKVALMTTSLNCRLRARWAAKHIEKLKSESRFRSWNSSKKMAPYPSRLGFCCSSRNSTPSVTTSMRVLLLTLTSCRMRYPTNSPRGSPDRNAIRLATLTQVILRGCSTRTLPWTVPVSSTASGTMVVLPAPVGA
mmetsp:Transcript_26523/g.75694  ORF Transcript_26523/g.75694 Transcript_26523/m.75694 type:complete len:240 (-) Transcript_26523:237-956(-)